ncbi:hypothetical protein DL766_003543 [Monosporascus sp. MC13-8B]|uniref:Uncharacterized protein n=1 Tax=Monosporascus cannonballus TaxID=155416 RepID=A0ABY0H893_9PEZI|nr:hypothetical protein DL762_004662 [Monosporascus cannonballus]RYP33314.1 hypothetical protein DL766_003543 [Monosporascus sp. MC13-8B]
MGAADTQQDHPAAADDDDDDPARAGPLRRLPPQRAGGGAARPPHDDGAARDCRGHRVRHVAGPVPHRADPRRGRPRAPLPPSCPNSRDGNAVPRTRFRKRGPAWWTLAVAMEMHVMSSRLNTAVGFVGGDSVRYIEGPCRAPETTGHGGPKYSLPILWMT